MKEGTLLVAFKMALVLVLVLVSLPLLDAANVTTLDDIFIRNFNATVHGLMRGVLVLHTNGRRHQVEGPKSTIVRPFTKELYEYLQAIEHSIFTEFPRVLAAVPVQSIYDDLNEHCSQYEETAIEDLAQKPRNTSCAQIRLRKMMTAKFNIAVEAGLRQVSRECNQTEPSFCSFASRNCTLAHEGRMRQILTSGVEDWNNVDVTDHDSHLVIIGKVMLVELHWLFEIYSDVGAVINSATFLNIRSLIVKPFEVENIVRPMTNKAFIEATIQKVNNTVSEDGLTWSIIRSHTGKIDRPCSNYRRIHSQNSKEFLKILYSCYKQNLFQSNAELMVCAYSDPKSPPVKWSKIPPVYFHSQCLCLAFKGKGCRVTAPQGVDPRLYCLSVLLRDFQRQVSYRPAITYLDYASQTRVPVCGFANLIEVSFKTDCNEHEVHLTGQKSYNLPLLQCVFRDLVNKKLNCSETLVVNHFNHSVLCELKRIMQFVLCDDETDYDVRVSYYGAGDSTLVLLLTYVDVVVRVLTLVTYLLCSELRNLPGKLLICYQVTALLRLLVVRAALEDMQMAVRLDVAMDLASTLWLTSYLHFLTASIKALRLPDSLSPDEVRMVLLRYALVGWVLPTALSVGFFRMDEIVVSRVQFGQMLFLLCNYAALLGNLYMFYHNLSFYYDVKSSALVLQRGGKTRSVFAVIFNFALKTSVLSGAGIVIRLVFTQIQGLEHVLGYYHALGTLQVLLLFLLYGCNRDARVFWIGVFRSTGSHCQRRRNTPDQ